MAKYGKDGAWIASTIFEAAAAHYAIKPVCSRCTHTALFNPHALWWHFNQRAWDHRLRAAVERFWCRECGARVGMRIRPRALELVRETENMKMICLTMPPEQEWKRAVRRYRS